MANDPMYEPKVPLRFEVRQRKVMRPQMRGGSPVYGAPSDPVTEAYRVLQFWNDDLGEWVDVPEVRQSEES